MVPGEFGHLPEYREVTGTPRGGYWAYMGLEGEEGRKSWEARPPSPIRIGRGAGPLFLPPSLLLPSSPTPTWKGGILLPVGVGLP